MKKITIITAFDNISEFEGWKYTVVSAALKNNEREIDFLTVVKTDEQRKEVQTFYRQKLSNYKFKVVLFGKESPSNTREGQLYWMFAPFFIKNRKYAAQFDNDVLINVNLKKMITLENKNKIVSGVKIQSYKSWPSVQAVISKIGIEKYEKNSKNWINGGVVLLRVDLWKKYYKNFDNLWNWIRMISDYNLKIGKSESDESLIFLNHFEETGSLNRRFNLRIHAPKTNIKFMETNDYIVHYFMYNLVSENERTKFNFIELFNSNISNQKKFSEFKKFAVNSYKLEFLNNEFDVKKRDKYLEMVFESIFKLSEEIKKILNEK